MFNLSNENIEIRLITKADNEGIYKLIQGILESYELDKPGTAYFDPYLSELYDYYKNLSTGAYWVLVKDDKVYGGIGIGPFGQYEGVAEVQKYYISTELQGQGYGRKLYEIAENFAKKQGYKKLYIETTDVLGKANDIYHRFGFENLDAPLDGSEHDLMNIWLLKNIAI